MGNDGIRRMDFRGKQGWEAFFGGMMIVGASAVFLVAGGCICDDPNEARFLFNVSSDTANSVSEAPSALVILPPKGPGECSFRYSGGPEATVFFHPPPDGVVVRVRGAKQAPGYAPPPWRFEGVRPGTTITVEMGNVADSALCKWEVGVGWDEKKLRWSEMDSYYSGVTAGSRFGLAAEQPAKVSGTPISAWFLRLILNVDNFRVDTGLCQQVVDFLQWNDVVLALRYPVDPGLLAGTGWRQAVVFRGDDRPTLTLTSGQDVLMEMPLVSRPEWLEFAMDSLPQAPDEAWAVLGAPTAPRFRCPEDLDEPYWSVDLQMHLDLGGRIDPYWEHIFEVYACYRGQSEPTLEALLAGGGTGLTGTGRSGGPVQADGVTCLGPMPVRLTNWSEGATPPYSVTLGVFSIVPGGGNVQIPGMLMSLTDDELDITTSLDSSLGIPWSLYHGDSEGPDLSRPVEGPITLPGWGYEYLWLVADVPEGMRGLDTTRLSAVAGGHEAAWNTCFLQVGEWTEPPVGTGWAGWVPVGSHAAGSFGSQWRSDLGLLNPGGGAVEAEVLLHTPAGTRSLKVDLPPRGQRILTDVVGSLEYTGAGSLEVRAPGELIVTSRSYSRVAREAECLPGGSLGQSLDGVRATGGLVAGQEAWIPQLVENSAFRSNIGLANMGSSDATVAVSLRDGSGGELAAYTVDLAPGRWWQDNRPFAGRAGRSDLDAGYAVVEVLSGAGIVAYGSVVDNLTNDPTTMPMVSGLLGGGTESWIPVAVHASGAHGSRWRTTVGLLNTGSTDVGATLRLYAGGSPATTTVTVPAGGQLVLDDVAGMLGIDGGGPLQVSSTGPLVVTSRTYTRISDDAACLPGGTLGQVLTATTPTPVLDTGQAAWIPHLVENAGFRSNIGFANTGRTQARVRVRLRDAEGTQLTTFDVVLAPHEWKQENRPLAARAGRNDLDAAWADVEVVEGSGVLVYGSVLDNITNDPTTVVARRR